MKSNVYRFLTIAARILGLLLIIMSLESPVAVIRRAIANPPIKLVSPMWTDHPLPWDMWSVILYYLSNSVYLLFILTALGSGLWLLLARFSWKNSIISLISLIVAVPWFLLAISYCAMMLNNRSFFS